MTRAWLVLLMVLLAGCDVPKPPQNNQEIRERLFFQCLVAIPKGPEHTKYNDWDDVVAECGKQAYMMSFERKVAP